SSCLIAISDAYIIPITAKSEMVLPQIKLASGSTGNSQRSKPNTPIFTITPLRTIVTAVGDCSYVSGCQVWKGKIGILIANAIKSSQKTQFCSLFVSVVL